MPFLILPHHSKIHQPTLLNHLPKPKPPNPITNPHALPNLHRLPKHRLLHTQPLPQGPAPRRPRWPPLPTFSLRTLWPQRPRKGTRSSPSSSFGFLPGVGNAAAAAAAAASVSASARWPAGTPTGGVTQRPPRYRYSDVMLPSVSSSHGLCSRTS